MRSLAGPILVGTDFSDGAARAFREARGIAASLGTGVLLVHAASGFGWHPDPEVEQWLAASGVGPEGVELRIGTPWAQIAGMASEVGSSLIVVGSHGRSGYHPLGPGSTVSQLLTRSPVPVLVVSAVPAAAPAGLPGAVPASAAGRSTFTAP